VSGDVESRNPEMGLGEETASGTPDLEGFSALGLAEAVLRAVEEIGYESPSPIQAQTIPHVLAGRDVVGQAQTGTGKTGAFALPLLSRLDLIQSRQKVQVLVLVPTRELAIQVSEAFGRYASHLAGFHVLPIYGGTGYEHQLKHLRKGSQVVVGTPGRIADHLRRGTLQLDGLKAVVLDEADEMLRMGFIDEVEWILEKTPSQRQIALFSATMPEPIRRIARNTLREPVEVTIRERTATASAINQRYWLVSGMHKLDALTRLLEAEEYDAMIIFVRMKTAAAELARKLQARGLTCEALSGDVAQREREAIVERVRNGDTDILVATDVAARGLDVPRITHVVNYDIPLDTESYIHRTGRTGRAGRTGEAILFVSPRERRLLWAIEKATRQKITMMQMPSMEVIRDLRVTRFRQRILDVLAQEEALESYKAIVEDLEMEQGLDMADIAAACARLAQGDGPELEAPREQRPAPSLRVRRSLADDLEDQDLPAEDGSSRATTPSEHPREEQALIPERPDGEDEPPPWEVDSSEGMTPSSPEVPRQSILDRLAAEKPAELPSSDVVYRVAVGHRDRLKPGMLVGAITNEAGIPGKAIGNIQIEFDHSLVVLPGNLSAQQERAISQAKVMGVALRLERAPEGTTVEPFVPGDRPRGGFADRPHGRGFAGPRDRDMGGFRRPDFGDRDRPRSGRFGDRDERPGRFEDRGGTNERSSYRPARRGFGTDGGGYRRPETTDRPPFRRDWEDRPAPSRDRDDRPDWRRDKPQDRNVRRDDRDERPSGRYDREDRREHGPSFRDRSAGPFKPKSRFQPPWDLPKGSRGSGKPKKK
jgi:ATP-dependent RNA helicase DeaD